MKNHDVIPERTESLAQSRFSDIKGLVLAGGASARMGRDKGDIKYYKKAQKYRVADMLIHLGLDTYISLRKEQKKAKEYQYSIDRYNNIGPAAGLLSAFEKHHTAWLVVACDYPLIKPGHLEQLFLQRHKNKTATVFSDTVGGFLLPTIAIYESRFFPILQHSLHRKEYSLQKLLKANDIKTIKTQDPAFKSVDTTAAYYSIKKELHEQFLRNP